MPLITHPKRVEQVEEHPSDDDVVIEGHEEGDYTRGDADAAQPGVDGVPNTHRAQPHLLTDAQLDEEQRYALQD